MPRLVNLDAYGGEMLICPQAAAVLSFTVCGYDQPKAMTCSGKMIMDKAHKPWPEPEMDAEVAQV